jgi:DeoR/GlpR family transcriptional regulator of sugar metabolism
MAAPTEPHEQGSADTALNGAGTKSTRQRDRQRSIAEYVLREGSVRIEELGAAFEISLMTIHRDLDELESKGLLRKSRGSATAMSSSVVEASDVFRRDQQSEEKDALARAVLPFITPGAAVFLDDSTTTARLGSMLASVAPLTVITNYLPLLQELPSTRDISVLGLGGRYVNWSSSYLGSITTTAIKAIAADLLIMSTSAVVGDTCFHHAEETVDVKRAMFESSAQRILLLDHSKFERRALHALVKIDEFDHVIVDDRTDASHVDRLRARGIDVIVAPVGGDAAPAEL